MVKPLLTSFMKASLRIYKEFDDSIPQYIGADWGIIVTAAGTDIILGGYQQLSHRLRTHISWHYEVSDLVAPEVGAFAWAIPLMPISCDQNPTGAARFLAGAPRQVNLRLLGRPVYRCGADTAPLKLIHDFRAVPVFVKVES